MIRSWSVAARGRPGDRDGELVREDGARVPASRQLLARVGKVFRDERAEIRRGAGGVGDQPPGVVGGEEADHFDPTSPEDDARRGERMRNVRDVAQERSRDVERGGGFRIVEDPQPLRRGVGSTGDEHDEHPSTGRGQEVGDRLLEGDELAREPRGRHLGRNAGPVPGPSRDRSERRERGFLDADEEAGMAVGELHAGDRVRNGDPSARADRSRPGRRPALLDDPAIALIRMA